METIKATPRELRKFGVMFFVILTALAAFSLYKGTTLWTWCIGGALFFLVTGLFVHQLLRPVYFGWMKFAFVLGWFNTRLILGIIFFLIFTPVGLILRLLGKDILNMRFNKQASSYWIKREQQQFDKKRYLQLF